MRGSRIRSRRETSVGRRRPYRSTDRRVTGVPLERAVDQRQRGAELAGHRLHGAREGRRVGEERALHRERLDAGLEGRVRAGDRLLERVGVARDRLEGQGRAGEEVGLHVGDRRHHPGGVAQLAEEAPEARAPVRQVGGHRRHQAEEARQVGDRLVERHATARQDVAEAVEVALHRAPRAPVVGAVEVVELHRQHGPRRPEHVAVIRLLGRVTAHHLEVLEPEQRARPDRERGVNRDLARGVVDPHRHLGHRPVSAQPHRAERAHEPIRSPPSRISAPRVIASPLRACTFTSSVGTNGSPCWRCRQGTRRSP